MMCMEMRTVQIPSAGKSSDRAATKAINMGQHQCCYHPCHLDGALLPTSISTTASTLSNLMPAARGRGFQRLCWIWEGSTPPKGVHGWAEVVVDTWIHQGRIPVPVDHRAVALQLVADASFRDPVARHGPPAETVEPVYKRLNDLGRHHIDQRVAEAQLRFQIYGHVHEIVAP